MWLTCQYNRSHLIQVEHGESLAQYTWKIDLSVSFNQFHTRLQTETCVFYFDPSQVSIVFVCQNPLMVVTTGAMQNLQIFLIQTQVTWLNYMHYLFASICILLGKQLGIFRVY